MWYRIYLVTLISFLAIKSSVLVNGDNSTFSSEATSINSNPSSTYETSPTSFVTTGMTSNSPSPAVTGNFTAISSSPAVTGNFTATSTLQSSVTTTFSTLATTPNQSVHVYPMINIFTLIIIIQMII